MKTPSTNMEQMRKGFEVLIRNPSTEDWIREMMVRSYTMVIGYEYIKKRDPWLAESVHTYANDNFTNHKSQKLFHAVLESAADQPQWVRDLMFYTQFLMIMYGRIHETNPNLVGEAKAYAFANHGMEGVEIFDPETPFSKENRNG
jgi:hypothetical protein